MKSESKTNTREREEDTSRASENIYLLVDIKANIIPSSLLLVLSPSLSYASRFILVTSRQKCSTIFFPHLILPSRLCMLSYKLNTSKKRMLCAAHCKVKSSTFPLPGSNPTQPKAAMQREREMEREGEEGLPSSCTYAAFQA